MVLQAKKNDAVVERWVDRSLTRTWMMERGTMKGRASRTVASEGSGEKKMHGKEKHEVEKETKKREVVVRSER